MKTLTLDLENEYHRQLELSRIKSNLKKANSAIEKLKRLLKSKESEVKNGN